MVAVSHNGLALKHVSEELRNNYDVVLAAVKQNGNAIQYASNELKSNYDIALIAVTQKGMAIEYLKDDLKDNDKIVLSALNENKNSFQFASSELQNDKQLLEIYVKGLRIENSLNLSFYKRCELKFNIWENETWMENNIPVNTNVSKPRKY